MKPTEFQKRVLDFYKKHGRKHLPWQQNKTHYRVWISEIMLQQTQVATVIPYYEKFMSRFPTLESLAKSEVDEVLALWTGLGYYTRARNLHKCAQQIVNQLAGNWPETPEEIEQLPGIGRSTAGAIHSLTTGKPATILDGNVKRVLCRFYTVEGWPGKPKVHNHLWELADKLTPQKKADHYNQAMMDLGATVCTRRNPACDICPLQSDCKAHEAGEQHSFPNSKPKKAKPVKRACFLIFRAGSKVLLHKRPSSGIWGGLWSLPEAESFEELGSLGTHALKELKQEVLLEEFRHTFSHYHLDIQPKIYELKKQPALVMDEARYEWQDLNNLDQLGLPSPVVKLLTKIRNPL
ncbi:MAG: A/G-specific adenine glycosylase [Gammaproteobacteria bacterium]|nr:A/G-specific adenine glycosylase [Gammaproteobacteria bacterium]